LGIERFAVVVPVGVEQRRQGLKIAGLPEHKGADGAHPAMILSRDDRGGTFRAERDDFFALVQGADRSSQPDDETQDKAEPPTCRCARLA
jgi:hypothetical protein